MYTLGGVEWAPSVCVSVRQGVCVFRRWQVIQLPYLLTHSHFFVNSEIFHSWRGGKHTSSRNNKLSATTSRASGLDASMTLPEIAVNSGGAGRWETLDGCLLGQELLTQSSAMRFEHRSQSQSPCSLQDFELKELAERNTNLFSADPCTDQSYKLG